MTARKPAEKRAFSIHGRDAVGLAVDFMRVCRTRLRKAAWHGRLRASRAQDRNSPTESDGRLGPTPEISVESARLGRSIADVRTGRSLTLGRAAAMKSRLPRRARCEAGGASRSFGGCREEDLSAPPQEPQTYARISQANADAGRT